MCRKRAILASLLTLCISTVAGAADLANNLSESSGGAGAPTINDTNFVAQAFSTSATHFVIDSVTVAAFKSSAGVTGTLNLFFYDATGVADRPNVAVQVSPIASVSAATLTTNQGDTYTWSGLNFALSASKTYYVVLAGASVAGGELVWDYSGSTAGTGFPSNYSQSSDTGVNWSLPSLATPQRMRVTAVPEPSSIALGAFGSLVMCWYIRRKTRKPA